MSTGTADSTSTTDATSSTVKIPQIPGQDVHAHAAEQYIEQVETRFTSHHLLVVAEGGEVPATLKIIDTDLSLLPELPHTHRDYARRQEARIKATKENMQNAITRQQLTLNAWTAIYQAIKISTV